MSSQRKAARSPIQLRDWPIHQLPGLSSDNCSQLLECGITTTRQLLQVANTPPTKQALASKLQIHTQYVHKWVALAELASIPSVGCQHCGLLLHAGVASVAQLAQIPVHRLHQQILRMQVAMMQRRDLCPSVDEVQEWVVQAKMLMGN